MRSCQRTPMSVSVQSTFFSGNPAGLWRIHKYVLQQKRKGKNRARMQDALRNEMFGEGDRVRVVGPIAEGRLGQIGTVCGVRLTGGIYRYYVEFEDNTMEVF